jgi:hypothetical protein
MQQMSISPFSARPATPETERRRARLVLLFAVIGISATLLAYAISPSVRHAVGHAAHSVKHAVSHALDPDADKRRAHQHSSTPAGARTSTSPAPSHGG